MTALSYIIYIITMRFSVFSLLFCCLGLCSSVSAQRMFTRNGQVTFDATSPTSMEAVKAIHRAGTCVLDKATGAVEMAVLMKGFQFERALMQEHFNENYVESGKFPKAVFKGTVDNLKSLQNYKDLPFKAQVTGKMTIHGVTKDVTAPITFTPKNGKLMATANFSLLLADYSITIPGVVGDKVNKNAAVKVSVELEPMK